MDRRMGRSNENPQGVMRPSNIQGFGNSRRALNPISTNIIKSPLNPSDVHKKGDFTEKNAGSKKNHAPRATRKFATHLSVQEKESLELPEVDEEGYVMIDDHGVPMYVQHTEAMMDEIDRMDAEEMDEDELVLDIDSCDRNDPLAVTEYINDLYSYYKKIESSSQVPPNYMAHQNDINERMRGILVDWLVEVHCKFELMDETLYLTVNIIDRFLALQQGVVRDKLQLIGTTALLLACKYEEVAVPAVEDLVLISDKAFCRDELLKMEKVMINTLQFNLSVVTPYVFIRRFLKAAQSDKRLEMLSMFIVELCLVEYGMLRFPPSLLAAAAVFTAQCALSGHKQWSKTCECHTSYNEGELRECAAMMVAIHQNSRTGRLTGVYKKYCTEKYGYAAWTDPAVFLADEAAF